MQGFSDFLEHMELKIKNYGLVLGFNDVNNKLWDSKCDINDYQQHARINKDSIRTTLKFQGLQHIE